MIKGIQENRARIREISHSEICFIAIKRWLDEFRIPNVGYLAFVRKIILDAPK
jgi:hypothetical protein